MAARIDVLGFTNAFVRNYMKNTPAANADDVRVALRNELQKQKRNGVKISPKEIVQAQNYVDSAMVLKPITVTEEVKSNIKTIQSNAASKTYKNYNAAEAGKHYDEIMNLSRKARHNAHERNLNDAKAAFGSDEFLAKLQKQFPDVYSDMTSKKPSNSEIKRQNNDYISSKKRKQIKLQKQQQSNAEHVLNRMKQTKAARNAQYLEKQSLVPKIIKTLEKNPRLFKFAVIASAAIATIGFIFGSANHDEPINQFKSIA